MISFWLIALSLDSAQAARHCKLTRATASFTLEPGSLISPLGSLGAKVESTGHDVKIQVFREGAIFAEGFFAAHHVATQAWAGEIFSVGTLRHVSPKEVEVAVVRFAEGEFRRYSERITPQRDSVPDYFILRDGSLAVSYVNDSLRQPERELLILGPRDSRPSAKLSLADWTTDYSNGVVLLCRGACIQPGGQFLRTISAIGPDPDPVFVNREKGNAQISPDTKTVIQGEQGAWWVITFVPEAQVRDLDLPRDTQRVEVGNEAGVFTTAEGRGGFFDLKTPRKNLFLAATGYSPRSTGKTVGSRVVSAQINEAGTRALVHVDEKSGGTLVRRLLVIDRRSIGSKVVAELGFSNDREYLLSPDGRQVAARETHRERPNRVERFELPWPEAQ